MYITSETILELELTVVSVQSELHPILLTSSLPSPLLPISLPHLYLIDQLSDLNDWL